MTLAGSLAAVIFMIFFGTAAGRTAGTPQTAYDLTTAADGRGWAVVNRTALIVEEEGRRRPGLA